MTCFLSKDSMDKMYAGLNENQLKIKKEISNERMKIYLTGLMLGAIISAIAYPWIEAKFKKSKLCIILSIVMTISYFYYIFSNKSKYMLQYLDNKEQIENWLSVYKNMQYNYHLGFLFGIAALLSLSTAFCK